jgi:hypothetical protein
MYGLEQATLSSLTGRRTGRLTRGDGLYIPMDEENSGSVTLEGRYYIYQDLDEMVDLPARFEVRCQRKLD